MLPERPQWKPRSWPPSSRCCQVYCARAAYTGGQLFLIIIPCRHDERAAQCPPAATSHVRLGDTLPTTISGRNKGRRAAHTRPPSAPPRSTSNTLGCRASRHGRWARRKQAPLTAWLRSRPTAAGAHQVDLAVDASQQHALRAASTPRVSVAPRSNDAGPRTTLHARPALQTSRRPWQTRRGALAARPRWRAAACGPRAPSRAHRRRPGERTHLERLA